MMGAAALRLFILYKAHFVGDGDEALTGIMANHILQGDRPIFLYGSPYMGATEAYFTAGWEALFGVSSWAMKVSALVASLAVVGLNYAVARRYIGTATAGLFAATLTALPSLYFAVTSLRAWNHSTETIICGQLLLLLTWAIIWGRPEDAEARRWWGYSRRDWTLWGLLGLTVGYSFYGHMLAFFYYVPIVIFLFFKDKLFFVKPTALIALVGFAVGSSPWWLYNLTNGWATLTYFFKPNDTHKESAGRVLQHYAEVSWPVATGAYNYWFATGAVLGIFLSSVYLLCLLGWAVARWRGLLGWARLSLAAGRPVDLLILLVIFCPILYVFWGAGNVAFTPLDTTGRYLLPLMGVLPVLLGGGLTTLTGQGGRLRIRRGKLVAWGMAGLLLMAVVGSNLALYRHADYLTAFQSPYFPELRPPEDNRPLITYLKSQGIEYATCNHWVGNRIILDSQDAIKCVDAHDLSVGGLDRFPIYSRQIALPGQRVAFVLLNLADGAAPMEARLKSLGVAYSRRDLLPYIVIIPISRPVSPDEVIEQLHYPL